MFYIPCIRDRCIFGAPKTIVSDQGAESNNKVVDSMLNNLGVEHRVTSSYIPLANGLTERVNQTIVQALLKHAKITKFRGQNSLIGCFLHIEHLFYGDANGEIGLISMVVDGIFDEARKFNFSLEIELHMVETLGKTLKCLITNKYVFIYLNRPFNY